MGKQFGTGCCKGRMGKGPVLCGDLSGRKFEGEYFDFRNQLSKFSFGQVIALPLIHYALLSPLTVHIMATLESLNEITHLYIFNSSGDLLIKHIYKVPMQHNKII